jgi:hypothetical protein
MNIIKKILGTDKKSIIKTIIKEEIHSPSYVYKSQNKRVLGDLEEFTQRDGERFYKLKNKLIKLSSSDNKKLFIAMNRSFNNIDC